MLPTTRKFNAVDSAGISYQAGPANQYAAALAVSDVNGNHFVDLVSSGVMPGNGDGTFQPFPTMTLLNGYPDGSYAPPLWISTVTNFPTRARSRMSRGKLNGRVVLFGNGDGTFQSPVAPGYDRNFAITTDFNHGNLEWRWLPKTPTWCPVPRQRKRNCVEPDHAFDLRDRLDASCHHRWEIL